VRGVSVVLTISVMNNECLKVVVEIALAVFTAAMAGFTAWLAWETRRLGKSSSESSTKQIEAWFKTSSDQIGVKTWLELEQRFDSEEMKRARKKLAQQLKDYSVNKHNKVSETVLNFFEDVGTAYKMGYLNEKLSESSFGFYASRWWEVTKAYVDQEQKRHGEDATLFEDFKYFAQKMRLPGEVIDGDEIQTFLDDEMKLD
jgi:hypothetical protein